MERVINAMSTFMLYSDLLWNEAFLPFGRKENHEMQNTYESCSILKTHDTYKDEETQKV